MRRPAPTLVDVREGRGPKNAQRFLGCPTGLAPPEERFIRGIRWMILRRGDACVALRPHWWMSERGEACLAPTDVVNTAPRNVVHFRKAVPRPQPWEEHETARFHPAASGLRYRITAVGLRAASGGAGDRLSRRRNC